MRLLAIIAKPTISILILLIGIVTRAESTTIDKSRSTPGIGREPKVFKSAIDDKLMVDCMLTALTGLKFPSPPDGQIARVKYPFVFSAE